MADFDAVLDFSSGTLYFAMGKFQGDVLFSSSLSVKRRDSSRIVAWLEAEMSSRNLEFSDISTWTCGMGPGSFTGLRIIASIVLGFTFGRKGELKVRGIPSAVALAESVANSISKEYIDSVGVLYDGRRSELLCYELYRDNNVLLPKGKDIFPVIDAGSVAALDSMDVLIALETERAALEKVLPKSYNSRVEYVKTFPVPQLMHADPSIWPWGRDSLLSPVYLRPPVHTKPSEIRTVC